MSNFWIIRKPGAAVEGPFTSAQVKDMAMRGDLSPDAMVAGDATQWAPAGRVKGLVFGAASTSSPISEAPALAATDAAPPDAVPAAMPVVAPPMVPHPPLQPTASATFALGVADVTGRVAIGKRRTVVPLIVAAAMLVVLGVVQLVLRIMEIVNHTQSWGSRFDMNWIDSQWRGSDTLGCCIFIGNVTLWGFWVAWLCIAHADVARFTQRRYHTSPGLALGLCFVPLFNIYWQVATPFKLARFVEEHSRQRAIVASAASPWLLHRADADGGPAGRSPTSSTAVMILQICAYVGGCIMPGASMLLFAISALLIQRGLNRIWTDAVTPAGAMPAQ